MLDKCFRFIFFFFLMLNEFWEYLEMLWFVLILCGEGRGGYNEGNYYKIFGKFLIEMMCVFIVNVF